MSTKTGQLHTDVSQLTITLTSPTGTSVVVHDGSIGGTDLSLNYPRQRLVSSGSMEDFHGEEANGIWSLQVVDSGSGETGRLMSWALNVNEGYADGFLFVGNDLEVDGVISGNQGIRVSGYKQNVRLVVSHGLDNSLSQVPSHVTSLSDSSVCISVPYPPYSGFSRKCVEFVFDQKLSMKQVFVSTSGANSNHLCPMRTEIDRASGTLKLCGTIEDEGNCPSSGSSSFCFNNISIFSEIRY